MKETKLIARGGFPSEYPIYTEFGYKQAAKHLPSAISIQVALSPISKRLECFSPAPLSVFVSKSPEILINRYTKRMAMPMPHEIIEQFPKTIMFIIHLRNQSLKLLDKLLSDPRLPLERILVVVKELPDYLQLHKKYPTVKFVGFFAKPKYALEFQRNGGIYVLLWEKDITQKRVDTLHHIGMEVWVMPGEPATTVSPSTVGDISVDRFNNLIHLDVDAIYGNDIASMSKWYIDHLNSIEWYAPRVL